MKTLALALLAALAFPATVLLALHAARHEHEERFLLAGAILAAAVLTICYFTVGF